jgi:membrane protease subunit HflK
MKMAWGDNTKGPWGNLGGGNKDNKPNNPFGGGSGGNGGGGGNNNNNNKAPFDFEKFFKKPSGGGNNGNMPEIKINVKGIIAILLLVVVGWMMTGFYVVDASEEGVVLRFGKYHRTATEGLRYRLPSPFERVYVVKKTAINSIQIGYRSSSQAQAVSARGIASQMKQQFSPGVETQQLQESLMITGDTNIANVTFAVQWRIKDSFNFLFKVANSSEVMEDTIKSVSESAMREVIGRTDFSEAMTTRRGQIEADVQKIIQGVLNSYESGIEIYAVNLNDVQNPEPVMPAFLDVETAKQDKETAINRAKSYENEVVPRARGESQKIIQEAEAYKQQVISVASGEAQRFISIYNEYAKAKDITKKRMYLETMQEVLTGTDKVIMDGKQSSGVVPYLALPELKKREKTEATAN